MRQAYKMVGENSAQGVSLESYIICLLGSSSMTILAESSAVYLLGIVEVMFVFFPLIVTAYYKKCKVRFNVSFLVSIILGAMMIYGVSQLFELLKNNKENNVSVSSYLSYITLSAALLFIADNILVMIATSISVFVYMAIIYLARSGKTVDSLARWVFSFKPFIKHFQQGY
jgi:hypothetical protein